MCALARAHTGHLNARASRDRSALDAIVASAIANPVEAVTGEKSKIKVYQTFCKYIGFPPHAGALRNAPSDTQAKTIKRYIFWLNHVRQISCDFKGARGYVAPIIRWARMKSNPLDRLQPAEYRKLKLAYNKSAVIVRKPKIALPKGMIRKLIRRWCSESSPYLRTHHIDSLLGTATMIYVSTGTRAGNILMGTGDNKREQVLLVGDVNMEHYLARPRSPSNKKPLFIINARQKNSKFPVITSIPFNTVTDDPAQFCTATRLMELVLKRKKEGAGPDQPLFLHPNGNPLSASVANTHLQSFIKEICRSKNLPIRFAKLFSLKSFRKSVATEMAGWGASPQTLARKLKHNAIDSQMSYICRYHDNNSQFEKDLYKCITPRKA
jgi:hypothetical protein